MAESGPLTFVLRVLDRAIADVAREEYQRLTEGMRPEDREKFVGGALDDLNNKLGRGMSPNYKSEWIALFYLTWYQLRQVHLAYTVLRYLLDNLKQEPPRQVIDFGCGSGAVQIALSILLAENSAWQNVAVHGIDSSEPMMRIGRDLWRKFRKRIVNESDRSGGVHFAGKLRRTLYLMSSSCSYDTSYKASAALPATREATSSGDCWLTAIHASYQSNRKDMEAVFGRIRKEHEPVIELVTFFDRYDPRLFFERLGFMKKMKPRSDLKVNSSTEITRWRKELREELKNLSNWRLLMTSVTWTLKGDDVVMIRSKK